jgi:hypothetical protein
VSVISEHWTLTASEVRILLNEGVLEKYEGNPPEWYVEMFSAEQRISIQNVIKKAREFPERDNKVVIDYINKQETWLREAFIVIIEEEIKTGDRRTRK